MTQQYTIVLPIKIDAHCHDELRRFLHIQLRSLNKFLDSTSVYEFLIIGKEYEIQLIQQALVEYPSSLPIRLISEDLILKKEVIRKMSGWFLQQALKLGVAKIIKTPLYLVLDTDCFLTKPFSYQDLFYQDKLLLDREPWTAHPNWWLGTIKIINDVPLIKLANEPPIAVTPQIFITAIVGELLDYLDQKENSSTWDEYLSSNFFTEFSLYWLFLLKTNRTELYQSIGASHSLLGNSLWILPTPWRIKQLTLGRRIKLLFNKRHREERKCRINQLKQGIGQLVKTSFESNTYFHFSLIQSNIPDIAVEWIIEQTNKYLN